MLFTDRKLEANESEIHFAVPNFPFVGSSEHWLLLFNSCWFKSHSDHASTRKLTDKINLQKGKPCSRKEWVSAPIWFTSYGRTRSSEGAMFLYKKKQTTPPPPPPTPPHTHAHAHAHAHPPGLLESVTQQIFAEDFVGTRHYAREWNTATDNAKTLVFLVLTF